MTKNKSSNAAPASAKGGRSLQALSKLVRGRGDYDVIDKGGSVGDIVKETKQLASRVTRLEDKVGSSSSGAKTAVGTAAGVLGRIAGTALGNGSLGQTAGESLAKYFGYGDYDITTNSLMGKGVDPGLKFQGDGKRGTRIVEREYIGDLYAGGTIVNGSTTFDIRSFAINPGMADTFPWLSSVAAEFEQYRPNGIIFEFKSTSSIFNSVSPALGAIIAGTEYNVGTPAYASKLQMESADYSESCRSSENMLHGIECDPKERGDNLLFVRTGAIPSNDNLKLYDLGTFQIATQGMAVAGTNLGEIWVSYDFTFYKKQLTSGQLGFNLPFFYSWAATGGTTIYPTGTITQKAGNIPIIVNQNKFTFPQYIQQGLFLLEYQCTNGAAPPGAAPLWAAFSNCVDVSNSMLGITGPPVWALNSSVSNQMFGSQIIRILGPNAVVQLTATLTSAVNCQVRIFQVNGTLPWPQLPL